MSDSTPEFLPKGPADLMKPTTKGGRTGYLVEYGPTEQIFESPSEARTQEYIRGEFS